VTATFDVTDDPDRYTGGAERHRAPNISSPASRPSPSFSLFSEADTVQHKREPASIRSLPREFRHYALRRGTYDVIEQDPFAVSTCRLCRTANAKINFTKDLGVIDVACERCGRFRVEIAGYNLRFDALTGAQRLRVLEFVKSKHDSGDLSPLISAEYLKQVLSSE
jgi:hypothetical protein